LSWDADFPLTRCWKISRASVLDVPLENLRQHDFRAPVEDLKKLAEQDSAFGAAFRTIVDKQITPEDLLKLAEGKPKRDGK